MTDNNVAISTLAFLMFILICIVTIVASKPAYNKNGNVCRVNDFYTHPKVGLVQVYDTIIKVDSGDWVMATSVENGGEFKLDCSEMVKVNG